MLIHIDGDFLSPSQFRYGTLAGGGSHEYLPTAIAELIAIQWKYLQSNLTDDVKINVIFDSTE